MKNRFIHTIFGLSLGLASCSGFLDEVPLSNVTDKNYYTTESDAEGAVNAIYETVGIGSVSQWQGTGNANTPYGGVFYNDYWLSQDLFSDNALHDNWLYANFDNFSLPETDGKVKTLWYAFYRAINTANIAIDRIPAIDMDPDKRDHLVGEARFWRGLLYAEAVKIWGDMPLRLKPSESVDELFGVERTDQLTVLGTAIGDLQFAIDNLMDNYRSGYGRADVLMANAVMAKVYLIKAARTHDTDDYQAAAD
ncbi:MAG: RagB/SusD family nutrient uptake outer membrane protein [Alistipes sp.]|nr:RagB/SusD family nutrient uptake outer membrane protein [Alistipes sp.]